MKQHFTKIYEMMTSSDKGMRTLGASILLNSEDSGDISRFFHEYGTKKMFDVSDTILLSMKRIQTGLIYQHVYIDVRYIKTFPDGTMFHLCLIKDEKQLSWAIYKEVSKIFKDDEIIHV